MRSRGRILGHKNVVAHTAGDSKGRAPKIGARLESAHHDDVVLAIYGQGADIVRSRASEGLGPEKGALRRVLGDENIKPTSAREHTRTEIRNVVILPGNDHVAVRVRFHTVCGRYILGQT